MFIVTEYAALTERPLGLKTKIWDVLRLASWTNTFDNLLNLSKQRERGKLSGFLRENDILEWKSWDSVGIFKKK